MMAPKVKKEIDEVKPVYKKKSPSVEFKSESKPKKVEVEKPAEKLEKAPIQVEKSKQTTQKAPIQVVEQKKQVQQKPVVTKQAPQAPQQQPQVKQSKKQKEVATILYDQAQIASDDEGWVQVEKKAKPVETRQSRAQNQENVQQIQKQEVKVAKAEPEVNKNIKEISRQVVQEKTVNKKVESKPQVKQQTQQLTKKQEKRLKKRLEKQEEEIEDGWVIIEHRHVVPIQKEADIPEEPEQQKEKKRGLLTQQEYKEAQEYSRQIEENFKRTQQQLDERFRAKAIAKTTGYQVKQQEEVPRVQYVPVTQVHVPQITVKPMTQEEIDQLVEAAKPKKVTNLPPKEFASNTAPVSQNVIKSVQQEKQELPKVQLKTKIIYNEIIQQQKENYIYRLESVEFKSDKPKGERFFQTPAVARHVVEQPKKRYQEQPEPKYVQKRTNENKQGEQVLYVPKESETKKAVEPVVEVKQNETTQEKPKQTQQKPENVVIYQPKQVQQQQPHQVQPVTPQAPIVQPQTITKQQQDQQPEVKQQIKVVQKQAEPIQQEVVYVPKAAEQKEQQQSKKVQSKQPKQTYQEVSPYVEKKSAQVAESKPVVQEQKKNGSQKKSEQEESPYVSKEIQNQQPAQNQEIKISAPLVEQIIQQLDERQSLSQGLSKSDHKKLNDLLADNTNQLETLQEEEADSFIVPNEEKTLDRILPGFLDMTMNTRKNALSQNIVVQNVTFEDGETVLHLETMLSILDCCREVVQDEYVKYVQKVRQERRDLLKNQQYEDYLQKIVTQGEDQFHILQEGFFYIAQSLEISEDFFQHSFVYYSQHEDHGAEFIDRLTYVQQNMKEIVPSSHVVRRQQGLELIQYQLNFIEKHEENQIFKEVLDKVNKHQDLHDALPLILSTIIDDIIFQQFNLEEEDKIKFISIQIKQLEIHKNDKEIKAILNKIEQVVEAKFGVDL